MTSAETQSGASKALNITVALLLVGSLTVFWGIHYLGYLGAYGWWTSGAIMVVAVVALMQVEDRFKGPRLERWRSAAMLTFSVVVAALTWLYASHVVADENYAKTFKQETLAFDHEASKPLQDIGTRITAFNVDGIVTAQHLTSKEAIAAAEQQVQQYKALVDERDAAARTYFASMAEHYGTLPQPARDEAMQGFVTLRDGMTGVYSDMGKAQVQWSDAVLTLLDWAGNNQGHLRLVNGRISATDVEADSQLQALLGRVQDAQNHANAVLDDADRRRLVMKERSDAVTAQIKAATK